MLAAQDVDRLLREHGALLQAHARVQARCTALLREQAARIRDLNARLMRSRAMEILGVTALAWEREDRAALEGSIPGLKRRVAMGREVAALQARIHALTREQRQRELARQAPRTRPAADVLPDALEASLQAADLVICQTGCLSHGDYWRVQDHCKRTGKVCMLVDRPDGVQIVRFESLTTQR